MLTGVPLAARPLHADVGTVGNPRGDGGLDTGVPGDRVLGVLPLIRSAPESVREPGDALVANVGPVEHRGPAVAAAVDERPVCMVVTEVIEPVEVADADVVERQVLHGARG
jgi:hypothetical protein